MRKGQQSQHVCGPQYNQSRKFSCKLNMYSLDDVVEGILGIKLQGSDGEISSRNYIIALKNRSVSVLLACIDERFGNRVMW